VKLLSDEMWPPEIAAQLRRRGYDVAAVAERPELRGQPDSTIFAVSTEESRAIVTENVGDYRTLAQAALHHGERHSGLIFTTDRRFPRADPRTTGRIVQVLLELLTSDQDLTDREYWLN
jgi:predicted nuclease of predicted toxin-antitoxin system